MSLPSSPTHVRPGFAGRAWRGFRRWRRTRPFWGGLFVILSGVEIFLTTQMSLGGLSFQLGPTGFLSWLIPVILIACGVLSWASPAQRMFYAIVAVVTAVFSLIGVNLGGFFLGLIFGIIGAGLVFAWTPGTPAAVPSGDGADSVDDADTGELPESSDGLVPGIDDPERDEAAVSDHPVPAQPGPATQPTRSAAPVDRGS
ncbi:DUF6114 domain-containing protein, partial [Asanoa sp. NPDC050611]|uniref:DUF6114 domain-containing protein n=1 Tax=Asanoa sp. NPDC050611 TaxID=3157098 RepID=UPI0033F39DE6